jgi:hypothetical protein
VALVVPQIASVNTVTFTPDAAFLLTNAAAPDTIPHIYSKRDNFTTTLNGTFPVQTTGYAQPFNEFAFGSYGSTGTVNLIDRLTAINCDTNINSALPNSTNTSQCNCSVGAVWINGYCLILTNAISATLASSTVNTTNPQAYS